MVTSAARVGTARLRARHRASATLASFFMVGTESKVESGVITSGTIKVNDTTKVVYTNISSYELPATGGSGTTLWYTMGTLLLAGAAYLMYKKRQWIMREGDATCRPCRFR